MNKDFVAFAYETITVTSGDVVSVLSRGIYDRPERLPCSKATISVNPGPPISYLVISGTVTSVNGHKVAAYGTFNIEGLTNIINFKTTSFSSGTTGSICVTYYH